MGRLSDGDFGCCGIWDKGCAAGNGCLYQYFENNTDEQNTENLMYAMKHCNVFKKIYIEKDIDFIKSWTSQVDENGNIIKKHKVRPASSTVPNKQKDILTEAQKMLQELGL